MSFISTPMGWILAQLSRLFSDNFAISVLVFTIVINLIMLPLTLKSQQSTGKQARIKHKLDALKKKYGDDRQKYSTAMQEVYNKEGISMGGGCLPMIVRLIIMMGVYYAIMSPFTYISSVDGTAITAAKNYVSYVRVVEGEKDVTISDEDWEALGLSAKVQDAAIIAEAEAIPGHDADYYAKIAILNDVNNMKSSDIAKDSAQEKAKGAISKCQVTREVEIAEYLNSGNAKYEPVIQKNFESAGGSMYELNKIDFNMFGIDLTRSPDFDWNIFESFNRTWLIPIASFLAALATGVITSKIQKKANPEAPNMMAMTLIMPLFSLYIAFGFPCAVGFYWACSSLISGGIQVATQLLYGPSVVNAKNQANNIIKIANKESKIIAAKNTPAAEE